MSKRVDYHRYIVERKRKYIKKNHGKTDRNFGDEEMLDLAMGKGNVETEPWMITGTNGCAAAVKALRVCFKDFLEMFSDYHFTGRLMQVVSAIYQFEHEYGGKTRSIFFSRRKPYFQAHIDFSKKYNVIDHQYRRFKYTHSEMRNEVTVSAKEACIVNESLPKGVSHYRIVSHLSIISDYVYVEGKKRFEPISKLNTMSVFAHSDFLPIYAYSNFELVVKFPEGVVPSENDTVIHCLCMELYGWRGQSTFNFHFTGSGVVVCDVF